MEQAMSPNEGIKKGVSVKTLDNKDLVSIMQRLAPQFGVKVVILQKEGEKYTHYQTDPQTHKQTTYTGSVPQGESYISIDSQKNDIGDFWKAVKAEEASREASANPPKI